MKKIFLLFLIVIPLNVWGISASSYIVMDSDNNRVLEGDNINQKSLIASITKMLTSMVVINNSSNLDKKIIISDNVLKSYGSGIYVSIGEVLSLRDLLYGLMLRSGNDAAIELAYQVGGSKEGFVLLMNELAKNIGMSNSSFVNSSGLEDGDNANISTVYDMAILSSYAIKNKEYRDIVGTKKITIKSDIKTYVWHNKNKLLSSYKYCTGGKTGYTKRAKRTLVTNASKDNVNLTVVTFNDGNEYNILQSGRFISIYTPVELVEYAAVDIDDYVKGGVITGINVYQYKHSFSSNFNSYGIVVRMHDDYKFEFKEGMMFQPIDVKLGTLWDSFTIWGANMLNNILRVFHFIPTYTELDAMPDGWRKKFGLQMCEEIKQALLSEKDGKKLLKNYRIMQIKEKFGGLRWYDNVSTKKVSEIINKYEYISMKTCIVCGEPATYISNGWISPYCDKHIDNKDYATPIEKFYNIDADDDSTVLD